MRALLDAPPQRTDDLERFFAHLAANQRFASSIDAAALGGALADRVGFAFVAGYLAAMSRLLGPSPRRACLAATEPMGVHPRTIQTTLERLDDGSLSLSGTKSFVTLATVADDVLVIARRGAPSVDELPTLVALRLPRDRSGIVIAPKAPTPFAPEVPHAELTFTRVAVEDHEVLPGDGYAAYLKPFRTIEDLHVLGALVGHLTSLARRGNGFATLAPRLAGALAETRALAAEPPLDPAVHLALGSLFERARGLASTCVASLGPDDDETRARFERDERLLRVAEPVRGKRLEVALAALGVAR